MRPITTTAINGKYDQCRLRRHEKRAQCIAVPGFMGTPHVFHKARLEKNTLFVIDALKMLPKNIRRSAGCTGVPWFLARRIVMQGQDYGLDVVDRLLSMAVALGVVTVVEHEGAPSDVAYIIIEDLSAIRTCQMMKEYRHAKWED